MAETTASRASDAVVDSTTTPTAPDATPRRYNEFGGGARTQWQTVRGRFLRHRAAMVSLAVLALLLLGVLVVPLFYPHEFADTSGGSFEGPSGDHVLGTDQIGRDLGAITLRGTQYSLLIALIVAAMATVIGVTLGALAGYLKSTTDTIISRLIDLFLVIPLIAVAAVAVRGLGGGWFTVSIILGLFTWMQVARINRAETLSISEKEFIEAARALGASTPRIVFRHILPSLTGTIAVNATLAVATAVLTEAALSFIGLGVQPPDTSLGRIILENYSQLAGRPWLFWPPFLLLVVICLCVNFIGDGLRDAFDPRQTKVRA